MKQIYSIQGMTCSGCSSHVATILSKVDGVVQVVVDLEAAQAAIEMEKPILLSYFKRP
ncbi:heavy metal-associated domain-containing protein [Mangrovimonas sp. YM274]|uniref:heavy-metal-associated domain-containing protein n=1 Tax=Mangrovimonas sp. YM274 TaxID=3070660 RepID=UPI0027DD3121|nr:heavy metal-associated domain-containing protein [Mangrovimonas sp. YM274]WMI67752.1 heavy metal-associated domain-containing protein [Mangrovimonas sp. YM274]